MGVRDRLSSGLALSLALGLAAATAGCKRKTDDESRKAPVTAPSAPTDRLAPDEAPEGTEVLHGLRLPLRSRVADKVGNITVVRSALPLEQLATYVRARVDGGTVTAGAASTAFRNVVVKGGDAATQLEIKVQPTLDPDWRSEMHVHVVPKSDVPPEASEEERWRRAGVGPDGKLIDRLKRE
jgi:hypothetical protein